MKARRTATCTRPQPPRRHFRKAKVAELSGQAVAHGINQDINQIVVKCLQRQSLLTARVMAAYGEFSWLLTATVIGGMLAALHWTMLGFEVSLR